jgi:hypothetical protein
MSSPDLRRPPPFAVDDEVPEPLLTVLPEPEHCIGTLVGWPSDGFEALAAPAAEAQEPGNGGGASPGQLLEQEGFGFARLALACAQ